MFDFCRVDREQENNESKKETNKCEQNVFVLID